MSYILIRQSVIKAVVSNGKFEVNMRLYKDKNHQNEIQNNDTIKVPDFIYARIDVSGNHEVQVKSFTTVLLNSAILK